VNVIHILDKTGTAIASDIAVEMDAAADASLWNEVVPSASVTDIAVTPLDGVTATSHYVPATPGNWVGQNGADFAPAAAQVIKLGTGLRGRSHRGRVFVPFQNQLAYTDGLLSSGTAAARSTSWQDFNDDMAGGAHNLAITIASYKLATQQPVVSFNCELPLGTQRRRQGRLRGG
jgi:uncharacterized protein YfiM (DUF2279 family)